ncbi:hypothetical protein AB0D56_37870, partial [Streptomyces sp. NPDC048209]|uniref:hypothetical protein n=1 Tax=Streptomyces sp. NPDC048209 TaxID=3156689 RepID=UPI003433DE42
ARRDSSAQARVVRSGTWLAAAGWSSWVLAEGPMDWHIWVSLGAGALFAGLAGRTVQNTEGAALTARANRQLLKRRKAVAIQWNELIPKVSKLEGCKITGVTEWPHQVGYSVQVELPADGTEVKDLAAHASRFASALRLRRGCGIEIVTGRDRGTAILRVTTKDVIRADIPLPHDFAPLSVNDTFDIGRYRNGKETLVQIREECGVLTGQTGSGKSNELNVVLTRLIRQRDNIVFVIDFTAKAATPFLRPWALTGQCARPAIDWVATTPEESLMMLTFMMQVIKARGAGYQDLMARENTDLIIPRPSLPQITLIVDEFGTLPGGLADMVQQISDTGRAAAVRTFVCALRGTIDYLPSGIKKQARLRIGMRVTDVGELDQLFDSGRRTVDINDAPYKGSGFVSWENPSPRPFKGYRVKPNDLIQAAIATSDIRPGMDPLSARVDAGKLYAARWGRTLPQLFPGKKLSVSAQMAYEGHAADPAESTAPGEENAGVPHIPATAPGVEPLTPDAVKAYMAAKLAKATAPVPAPEAPADPADAVPADAPALPLPPPVSLRKDPQERCMELIIDARNEGTGATALEKQLRSEEYPTTRTTIQGWITKWVVAGELAREERGAGRVFYVHKAYAAPLPPLPTEESGE